MNHFQDNLEQKWTTSSLDLSATLHDKPKEKMLSLENEDEEFISKHKRVTSSNDVADMEDHTNEEIGIKDPYLNMERQAIGSPSMRSGMHGRSD